MASNGDRIADFEIKIKRAVAEADVFL